MNKQARPDGFILNFSRKKYEVLKSQIKPVLFVKLIQKNRQNAIEAAQKVFQFFLNRTGIVWDNLV